MLPICRPNSPPNLMPLEVTHFPPAFCHWSPRRPWSLQLVTFLLQSVLHARGLFKRLVPLSRRRAKSASSIVTRLSHSHTSSLPSVLRLFQVLDCAFLPLSLLSSLEKDSNGFGEGTGGGGCILSLGTKVKDAATTKERFSQGDSASANQKC